MTPESPPLTLPRVCAGDSRLGPGGLPTLQLLEAPGLQLTPLGQGPITPMWPLGTDSPETRSLHGCPGQGTPAQAALLGLGAAGCSDGSEHFASPQMPTQCKAQQARKFKRVTRVAANAQGRDSPLSHLAHGVQLPCSLSRHKAQAGSSRPAWAPAGLWPLQLGRG